MYTKADLKNQLHTIGVNQKGALIVHLSYKAIGDVDGRADTVLDALSEYMAGGLLVLQGHTWRNVNADNPVMDALHTPTCVGICTELFRKRAGVLRSLHPTHSVLALGHGAEKLVSGEENLTSPAPEGGVYNKLWAQDAQILLIGVNFIRNTFIHGIEEWDGATDTLSPTIADYYVITPEGNRLHTPQYRHNARIGSDTFTKLEPLAIQKNILTLGTFGDATTRLMSTRALRDLVAPLLEIDSNYLNRY